VCKRKESGGLGTINLWDFNQASLLKWWWKLFSEPGRKWASLVAHNYQPVTGWWRDKCKNIASSSLFWKGGNFVNHTFFLVIMIEVNNGKTTRF